MADKVLLLDTGRLLSRPAIMERVYTDTGASYKVASVRAFYKNAFHTYEIRLVRNGKAIKTTFYGAPKALCEDSEFAVCLPFDIYKPKD